MPPNPLTSFLSPSAPHSVNPAAPLDQVLDNHPLPNWRFIAWIIMAFLCLAIGWTFFAELDEIAIANGEVVPQGKTKIIQHLEGGIIQELFVKEGDLVTVGDTLVQLDLGSGGTNVEELRALLDGQLLVRARLEAAASGGEIVFPDAASKRQPAQVIAQRQAFEARQQELNSTLGALNEKVKQKELATEELEARRAATNRNYKLAKERFRMSTSLLEEGLTPKIDHLKLEGEVEELRGKLKGLIPAIPKARAAVNEAKQRYQESNLRFRRRAQEELTTIEQDISQYQELLLRATEQGGRAEIKSPIDGIVKKMAVNTIGGVIAPGAPIMEIVPTGDNLVIESRLNPTERGFVSVNQKATVKISSYDFARYGGLDGKVIRVAPGTSTDEDGSPYFRVVIQTNKNYLGDTEGSLPIIPGMQATVDIQTGRKSVLDYLIRPVLKLRDEAFRER